MAQLTTETLIKRLYSYLLDGNDSGEASQLILQELKTRLGI